MHGRTPYRVLVSAFVVAFVERERCSLRAQTDMSGTGLPLVRTSHRWGVVLCVASLVCACWKKYLHSIGLLRSIRLSRSPMNAVNN